MILIKLILKIKNYYFGYGCFFLYNADAAEPIRISGMVHRILIIIDAQTPFWNLIFN